MYSPTTTTSGDLGYEGFPVTLNYFTGLPDPSIIHSPTLVIIFKSLLKKDSITKERSLNDLIQALDNPEHSESFQDDLTIISWIQMYPKLAIENSRTVRALAHQVQGKFLKIVGGKAFSKYLKSSIPIWLQGLFDNDKTVSTSTMKSLMDSFQNDKSKVDKLWLIFYDQIVNYCTTCISSETHESLSDQRYIKELDSFVKYDRILNGSIQLLIKLMSLENETSEIERLLLQERLWDYLGSSINDDTLNLNLFKSLLALVKSIFVTEANQPNKFIANLDDAKSLFKLVSKKFIKLVRLKSKTPIIYSNVILQLWDTLIVLTNFSNISNRASLKIKKTFWQLGGNKSYSRLVEYLKLGSCNLDPVYYTLLKHFFVVLSTNDIEGDDEFLNFNDFDDAKLILIKILTKQFKEVHFKYKQEALSCILKVSDLFYKSLGADVLPLFHIILYTVLDVYAKKDAKKSLQEFGAFLNNINVDLYQDLNSSVVNSAIAEKEDELIVSGFQFQSKVIDIVDVYFQLLEPKSIEILVESVLSEFEDLSISKPYLVFHLMTYYVQISPKPEISSFLETCPSFIEDDFVDPPVTFLIEVLKRGLDLEVYETIEDFYLKLSYTTYLPKFVLAIEKFITIDEKNVPDLYGYIIGLSKASTLSLLETDIIFHRLNDPQIFQNTLNSTSTKNDPLTFIKKIGAQQIDPQFFEDSTFQTLLAVAWAHAEDDMAREVLNQCRDKATIIFEQSLATYVIGSSLKTDFNFIATFLNHQVPTKLFEERVKSAIEVVPTNLLAISNPLSMNSFLVHNDLAHEFDTSILAIGNFLRYFSDISNSLLLGGLIGEYIHDYLFLESISEIANSENLLEIKKDLQESLLQVLENKSINELLEGDDGNVLSQFLSHIEVAENSIHSFYSARVYKLLLEHFFDSMTLPEFELLPLNFNKLTNQPLRLSAILTVSSRFFGSTKFDRIRNFVAAEILGVKKESQILTDGLKWITLSINFFNCDEKYEVIPLHRATMILNHISNWLESDIAYDDEFISMRVLIAKFLNDMLATNLSVPDNAWDIAVHVVTENLSICQMKPESLDLRYFTLKLFTLISKSATGEIIEEILEVLTNEQVLEYDVAKNNQPVLLIHDILTRIFNSITVPTNLLNNKISELCLLTSCKFTSLQRVSTNLLHKLILSNQQDFVVEYQLQKSNLSEEDTIQKAVLPEILLAAISAPLHDIGEGNDSEISRYLWSWYLIFAHFEDITFSIRTEYINQLKSTRAIDHLFDYIFDQVDVSDNKVLRKLVTGDLNSFAGDENLIQNYDIKDDGEPLEDELRFLLLHLYYLSFRFFGSYVQAWFKEIRDRQLKQRIEKFSMKFVSPLLISKILKEVMESKHQLQIKDENLTIKVNTATNEIKSVYVIDEQIMEMVIKVPTTYPLENVTVEGPLRLGVKENQWKGWLLASQRVISLTNGSIMESIELFNRNVNLHFSGFEDCSICYSILHQDLSLPSKTCPTCSNKFHAACLYKWFKSSGSSTCPLCRSAFNFRVTR